MTRGRAPRGDDSKQTIHADRQTYASAFRRCVGGRDFASTVDEPAQSILTIRNADHNIGAAVELEARGLILHFEGPGWFALFILAVICG